LRPIHDEIFSILEKIPQDGTYDQARPLQELIARLKARSETTPKKVFSYDLSAATDRVPIDLQTQLLSLIYNYEVAEAWKGIMVDRD